MAGATLLPIFLPLPLDPVLFDCQPANASNRPLKTVRNDFYEIRNRSHPLLICGAYTYVASSFDWQLALAYGPLRRHITFRAQSVRRNDINPLSSAHLLVRVVSFTSQVASALAFISRSISA